MGFGSEGPGVSASSGLKTIPASRKLWTRPRRSFVSPERAQRPGPFEKLMKQMGMDPVPTPQWECSDLCSYAFTLSLEDGTSRKAGEH